MKLVEFYDPEKTMPARSVFILISGRAGVGKSTLASFLHERLVAKNYKSIKISFADSVKDCAIDYFNWNGKKDDKGRKLLQNIGNIGREYNENLWAQSLVNTLLTKREHAQFIIVDDWRFKNELQYIKNKQIFQTVTIRVESPERETLNNTEFYNNISEISLPSFDVSKGLYDIHVFNPKTLTLDEYAEMADQLVETILS